MAFHTPPVDRAESMMRLDAAYAVWKRAPARAKPSCSTLGKQFCMTRNAIAGGLWRRKVDDGLV